MASIVSQLLSAAAGALLTLTLVSFAKGGRREVIPDRAPVLVVPSASESPALRNASHPSLKILPAFSGLSFPRRRAGSPPSSLEDALVLQLHHRVRKYTQPCPHIYDYTHLVEW
eukprot:RCo032667